MFPRYAAAAAAVAERFLQVYQQCAFGLCLSVRQRSLATACRHDVSIFLAMFSPYPLPSSPPVHSSQVFVHELILNLYRLDFISYFRNDIKCNTQTRVQELWVGEPLPLTSNIVQHTLLFTQLSDDPNATN